MSMIIPVLGTLAEQAANVSAQVGAFALGGQAADLRVSHRLVADAGTFAEAGQNVSFGRGFPVVADVGDFALLGQDAGLHSGRRLAVDLGAFVETGQAASFRYFNLAPAAGAFSLSGKAANLIAQALELEAGVGAFGFSGQAVGFTITLAPPEAPRAIDLTPVAPSGVISGAGAIDLTPVAPSGVTSGVAAVDLE